MKLKRISAAICIGLATISAAAFAAGAATVSQKGLSFSTPNLTVAHGTVVTFMNDDTVSHNIIVTGNGVNVNSGLQAPGTPFRMPFLKPGMYVAVCGIHPKMKMTVTVS